MSTIETTPLDGGLCAGKNTITDMKAKGWNVDDIKISQTTIFQNVILHPIQRILNGMKKPATQNQLLKNLITLPTM